MQDQEYIEMCVIIERIKGLVGDSTPCMLFLGQTEYRLVLAYYFTFKGANAWKKGTPTKILGIPFELVCKKDYFHVCFNNTN